MSDLAAAFLIAKQAVLAAPSAATRAELVRARAELVRVVSAALAWAEFEAAHRAAHSPPKQARFAAFRALPLLASPGV